MVAVRVPVVSGAWVVTLKDAERRNLVLLRVGIIHFAGGYACARKILHQEFHEELGL